MEHIDLINNCEVNLNTDLHFRSVDIPGFYHRLYFSGGESEVRAHLQEVTVLENALLSRGTVSRRLSDGRQVLSLFYLDNELISCKIESDPIEVAEFYRLMMDDFNCAEHKTARRDVDEFSRAATQKIRPTKSSLGHGNNDLIQLHMKKEREEKVVGGANEDSDYISGNILPARENEARINREALTTDEDLNGGSSFSGSRSAEEPFYSSEEPPLWCSIEDRLERQIWNETFVLLDQSDDQTELTKEVTQALHFRVSRCEHFENIQPNILRNNDPEVQV